MDLYSQDHHLRVQSLPVDRPRLARHVQSHSSSAGQAGFIEGVPGSLDQSRLRDRCDRIQGRKGQRERQVGQAEKEGGHQAVESVERR
jgi:hypothetical protein